MALWYSLIHPDGKAFKGTTVTKLRTSLANPSEDVCDFRDAVKGKHCEILNGIDATTLNIFANKATFDMYLANNDSQVKATQEHRDANEIPELQGTMDAKPLAADLVIGYLGRRKDDALLVMVPEIEIEIEPEIIPFLTRELGLALDAFFLDAETAEGRPSVPDKTEMYMIQDVFGPNDSYWTERVQVDRFAFSVANGVLYRNTIVNDMIAKVDAALTVGAGVIIDGRDGVGKSHTLVNMVRKLNSSGNYLVTIIPDCAVWRRCEDLCSAICESFGSTMQKLRFYPRSWQDDISAHDFDIFIKAVDKILKIKGKKWVFIFDQVNELFHRHEGVKSVRNLPFPENQVRHLILKDCRTCIMSVSFSNHSTLLWGQQPGFIGYNFHHPDSMSVDEVRLAFGSFIKLKLDMDVVKMVKLSNGIPSSVHFHMKHVVDHHIHQKNNNQSQIHTLEVDKNTHETIIQPHKMVHVGKTSQESHKLLGACDKDLEEKSPMPSNQKSRRYTWENCQIQ